MMKDSVMSARRARLGIVSAGVSTSSDQWVARACSLYDNPQQPIDADADACLNAVDASVDHWVAFNVCTGGRSLDADGYQRAVRWLLDAGVDLIVCLAPVIGDAADIVGANLRAKLLGICVLVVDSAQHASESGWSDSVLTVRATRDLQAEEVVWQTDPNVCVMGGHGQRHAGAVGAAAGVALTRLRTALPRGELMDALRLWAAESAPRLTLERRLAPA